MPDRVSFTSQFKALKIRILDEEKTMVEWAELYNIPFRVLLRRVYEHNMSPLEAIQKPYILRILGKSRETKQIEARERTRKYKERFPEKVAQKRSSREYKDISNKRYRDRYNNDINFRVKQNIRRIFHKRIKSAKNGNPESTMEILGASWDLVSLFIERQFLEGMTWDNYGSSSKKKRKWNIDHIKPCNSYDLLDNDECRKCFHFSNLRPMWAIENSIKNDRFTGDDFHIDIFAKIDKNGQIERSDDYQI